MKIYRKYTMICISLFMFFPPSMALAQGLELGLGIMEEYNDNVFLTKGDVKSDTATMPVELGLGVMEEYNDNVFLTKDDIKSDTATVIEPSLKLRLADVDRKLNLSYKSSLLYYNKYNNQNRYHHLGEVEGEIGLPVKSILKLQARDNYDFFQKDIRQSESTSNQAEGNNLDVRPSISLNFLEPVYIEAGYVYQRQDYRNPEAGVEWRAAGPEFALGINLMPELNAALLYQHLDKDFSPNSSIFTNSTIFSNAREPEDYTDNRAGIRLERKPSDKIEGKVTYYRLWRRYVSGREFNGNNWKGELTLKPLDKMWLECKYSQDFLEKVEGGPFERRDGELLIHHHFEERGDLSYGVFGYRESFLETYRVDMALGGRGSLSINLGTRFLLSLGGTYERQIHRGGDREDYESNYYTANAEGAYSISEWLKIFISYTRTESNPLGDVQQDDTLGNAQVSEYKNNVYLVGLKLIYL